MTHRTVREVMTTDVACASQDMPFKEAAELMARRHVSALPVLDPAGRVSGVVSESDLLRKEEYQDHPGAPRLGWRWRHELRSKATADTVRGAMTFPAVTVAPDISVVEAARVIDRHHVKRLPVIGPDGRLAGIVSRADLLRVFLRSDEEIAGEVKTEVFGAALGTNLALVRVEVSEGVVTLAGEVEKKSMVPMATHLVRAVDGVVDVVNQLEFAIDDAPLPKSADLTEFRNARFTSDRGNLKQVE